MLYLPETATFAGLAVLRVPGAKPTFTTSSLGPPVESMKRRTSLRSAMVATPHTIPTFRAHSLVE